MHGFRKLLLILSNALHLQNDIEGFRQKHLMRFAKLQKEIIKFPSIFCLHCLGTRLSAHTARTPNALSPAAEVRPLSAFLAQHVRVDANLQAVDWHPRNVYCSVPPVLLKIN